MKKKLIVPITALILLVAAGYGSAQALAQGEVSPSNTLVQIIAERFGLSETEVQEVFDEARAEHHALKRQFFEDRLNEAVEDGLLTQEQKETLQAMHEEHRLEMEALRDGDFSREEMREQMRVRHDELQTWLQGQNLDLSEILGDFKMGSRSQRGFGYKHII